MTDRPPASRPQIPQSQARSPCPARAGCCGNRRPVAPRWAWNLASSSDLSGRGPCTPLCSWRTGLLLRDGTEKEVSLSLIVCVGGRAREPAQVSPSERGWASTVFSFSWNYTNKTNHTYAWPITFIIIALIEPPRATLMQPIRTRRGLKLTGIFSDLIKRWKYVNSRKMQCASFALKTSEAARELSLALDMLIVKRLGCSPLLSNWKMTLIKAHVPNMRTLSGWSQCCNLLLSSLSFSRSLSDWHQR